MQKGQALIFLLIGILVIFLAGGAFYLGKQTSPKAQSQNSIVTSTPQSSPTPGASPVPDGTGETANWKTYTDTENKFAFKYPSDWLMKDRILPNYSPTFESSDFKNDKYTPDYLAGETFKIKVNDSNKTLDQLEAEQRSYQPKPNTDQPPILTIKRVVVNGHDAIQTTSRYGAESLVTNIIKGNKIYNLICSYVPDNEISMKTCQVIVSTFHLLQ